MTNRGRSGLMRRELTVKCLELRSDGMTVEQIRDETGLAYGTVYKLLREATARHEIEAVTEMRSVQNEQIDTLIQTFLPMAVAGDYQAADKVLKALQRQAALNNLDMTPTVNINSTVEVTTPQDEELRALLAQAEQQNRVIEGQLATTPQ